MPDALLTVSAAKELFSEMLQVVDQRIIRIFNRTETPLKEFSLQLGQGLPPDQSIQINTPAMVVVPWDADAFRLRLWTQPGCAITVAVNLARGTDPNNFVPTTGYSATPLLIYEDQVLADGSIDNPLAGGGFPTQLVAGDILQFLPTDVEGIPGVPPNPLDPGDIGIPDVPNSYWGAEITCRLRTAPQNSPSG
jgi:hypothetical protein